nr:hypothetical protein [Acidisarcina polymorpha]
MHAKLYVKIPLDGGIELGAWLFLPDRGGPRPGVSMAHGFAGIQEHGIEPMALHLPARALWCWCMIIATSAQVVVRFAAMLIPGRRYRTGGERSPISKQGQRSTRSAWVYGEQATLAAMLLFWALLTAASGA